MSIACRFRGLFAFVLPVMIGTVGCGQNPTTATAAGDARFERKPDLSIADDDPDAALLRKKSPEERRGP